MKIFKSFLVLLTVAGILSACQQEVQYLGVPRLALSGKTMEFEIPGGAQDLELTATRDWSASSDEEWVVVTPDKGTASLDPQKFTVTVLENKGVGRKAEVVFTIGMTKKTLVVSQEGPLGSAEDLIVYSNNFDKSAAVKDGSYWPYPDQSDCWQNQTGTGASSVGFGAKNITVRDNSNSNTYAGASGTNNIFFGAAGNYFMISEIAMPATKDFTISFGAIRNQYDESNTIDNTFKNSEFHVWISADGEKWTEVDYAFAGGPKSATWDMAEGTFSLSEAVSALYVAFTADVASSYRLDDFSIVIASEAGKAVNLSAGTEKDFTASSGSGGGGTTTVPESKGKKTVQEFIAAADKANYYELTGTVSGFYEQYCSFDLTDATGKIYVYSVLDASKSEWKSKIKNGGTITIYGKYEYYDKKEQHEVIDAYIVSYTGGTGSEDGGDEGGSVGGDTGGEKGEYDPDGVQWTLGDNAYDKSSSASQTAVVNGVQVNDLLKLGTSSKLGNTVLHVPAGTKKIGFYGVSWTKKGKATLKFTSGSNELASIEVNENAGATGNPPYTITVTDSDWYEVEVSATTDMDIKVETTNTSSPRAILIGLKAITE
ncbi:MAG: hypothetical protein E7124_02795 [Bacteroidales bacterium]|nr:hypothetical protein [Bacteroidales bacterium]